MLIYILHLFWNPHAWITNYKINILDLLVKNKAVYIRVFDF